MFKNDIKSNTNFDINVIDLSKLLEEKNKLIEEKNKTTMPLRKLERGLTFIKAEIERQTSIKEKIKKEIKSEYSKNPEWIKCEQAIHRLEEMKKLAEQNIQLSKNSIKKNEDKIKKVKSTESQLADDLPQLENMLLAYEAQETKKVNSKADKKKFYNAKIFLKI